MLFAQPGLFASHLATGDTAAQYPQGVAVAGTRLPFSWKVADKYVLHELAKVTGHRDIQMLLRYYHPRAEDLAKRLA